VAEGQRVQVQGTVSEIFNMTELTASTAGSVVITNAGNNLAQVTPSPIDLPVVGVINDFYEAREGMKVTFVDSLSVAEYFELARFGQLILFEGGRPRQFTEQAAPSIAGNTAYADTLARRIVTLDDNNDRQNPYLPGFGGPADGLQSVFYPQANGGFSIGTQGTDFFRGGDLVNGLTGVLHWSFNGVSGNDAWRIRPTATNPAAFTVNNSRPGAAPAVGGAIKAAGMNLLNYFTTIDTTASSSSGPCAPDGLQDCRGADSVAELNRQRERASIVVCGLNADVFAFMELENTTASATITDLLGAINTRCGGAHPYDFVNTGGTLGTDAIRVQMIYRTGILSPVGSPLVDLDPIHNRPPTAQTFDVVDATNPAFGKRFTVIANHFKSKGCDAAAIGSDADSGDGQGCYNGRRTSQASRLLTWLASTVLPAAGDPDVLLLGDFNAYAQENPVTTLVGGGFTDLETALLGANAYSYLFDGQLGHLDYAFSTASLTAQVTGVGAWHINADEVPLFDYNDEVKDAGEAAFEEKPDGSALVPPRVVFQPSSPFRASDHDPVLVGLFQVADLSLTKTDSPDPVAAGANLSYTVTVTNSGPDAAAAAHWSDTLPVGTSFVSLPSVAGWSCTTPPVGSGGTVSCDNPSLAVGSVPFTLTVAVDPALAAGTVLSNTATASSSTGDPDANDLSDTATTTVAASADLSVTKVDSPDPVTAGNNIAYTITLANAGPSVAAGVSLSDPLPVGTTFVSLASPGGWDCSAVPPVGSGGTVTCTIATLPPGAPVFTLTVAVNVGVPGGTVLTNVATATSSTADPLPGDESGAASTTVVAPVNADISVLKVDAPDPVAAGDNLTYTIQISNEGPDDALTVTLDDPLPPGTTFVSLASPAGWSCTPPAVGSGGTVSCSIPTLAIGTANFTLVVLVDPSTAGGTVLSNTATIDSTTIDLQPGDHSATALTTVTAPPTPALSLTKTDDVDPVAAGANLTYTIVASANNLAGASAQLDDTVPTGTTFVSFSAPAGWICSTPGVGGTGAVSCSTAALVDGDSTFTLVVAVGNLPTGTVLHNHASIHADTGVRTADASADQDTALQSPASVTATKAVNGTFLPGSTVTYTVTLSNAGPGDQADASGDEFTDALPAPLGLVSATASSGTALATIATNTVTWNGAIPAGGAVTLTIQATLPSTALAGTAISNQGAFEFDSDGDGTNDTSGVTDDPATGAADDATAFTVAAPAAVEIPALDGAGIAALALLLSFAAIRLLRGGRDS
jgi:uncharacterized repeat protein (TIGR01451 family)